MNKIVGVGLMVVGLGAMVYGAVKTKKNIDKVNEEFDARIRHMRREQKELDESVKEMLKKRAAFEEKVSGLGK